MSLGPLRWLSLSKPPEDRPGTTVTSMGTEDGTWAAQFPELFGDQYVAYAGARTSTTTDDPPEALVNRLHLVAVTEDDAIVVCRSTQGWRFLPGGTREPGESLTELAARELREEAGAELLDEPGLFASFRVHSERTEPYRPHLAHPDAYWAHAVCRVAITGPPENPPDGEQVVEVATLPPDEATAWLARHDRTHADIVRLAVAMGLFTEKIPEPAVESGPTRSSSG